MEPVLLASIRPKERTAVIGMEDVEVTLTGRLMSETKAWPALALAGEVKLATDTTAGASLDDCSAESIVNKVATVTAAFWIMKICASTLGKTAGDLLSMTINVGYGISSQILLSLFLLSLVVQLRSQKFHPLLYWTVIVFGCCFMVPGMARAKSIVAAAPPTWTADASGSASAETTQNHDLRVMIVAGGAFIGAELLKPYLAPQECRWCDLNADGTDNLNSLDASVRQHVRWSDTVLAGQISGILAYGVAPASAIGLTWLAAGKDGRGGEFWPNTVLILESTFLASDVTQITKFTFGRARPYIHAQQVEDVSTGSSSVDDNLSFISGHTSSTFALAVSAGRVASLRGYRHARLVLVSGLAIAATTGYLRIAADEHYLTDVLAGAAVGSVIGWVVPSFLHTGAPLQPGNSPHDSDQGVRITPLIGPKSAGLALSCAW